MELTTLELVWKFLIGPVGKWVALAVLVGGLGLGVKHYHGEALDLEKKLIDQKIEFTAKVDGLTSKLSDCSSATSELKKASDNQGDLLRKAQGIAASEARKNEAFAQELLNTKPQLANLCDSANALATNYLKKVQGEKK